MINRLKLRLMHSGNRRCGTTDPMLYLDLRVDGAELAGREICLRHLALSAWHSGAFFIFTCRCGQPECAGIWRPIQVVHEPDSNRMLWRVPDPISDKDEPDTDALEGDRWQDYRFERDQYVSEIRRIYVEGGALLAALGLDRPEYHNDDYNRNGREFSDLRALWKLSEAPPVQDWLHQQLADARRDLAEISA